MSTFDDAVGYHWGTGAGWLRETSGTPCGTRVVRDEGECTRVGMGVACEHDGVQGEGESTRVGRAMGYEARVRACEWRGHGM